MSGSIKSLSAKINSGEIIEDLGSKMTEMKNQIQGIFFFLVLYT